MRRAFARNSLGWVAIVLVLAMPIGLTGCESSSDEPDMVALLCGTWEGTYTPTAAWDENGPVEDPPFELGMPLAS